MKTLFLLAFVCFQIIHEGSTVSIGDKTSIVWTRDVPLDNAFNLKFNNEDPENLVMEISAPTKGWVSIGFSPNGAMKGSDILMGWVDSDGQAHIKDLYAVGNSVPLEDETSNYKLLWAEENEYGTTIRFSRLWDTCDSKHDFEITEDTIRLIWATNPHDPVIDRNGNIQPHYHGPDNRGVKSMFIKVKTHLKKFPDDEDYPDPNVKYWDVRMNRMLVPSDSDTTYYCKIVKTPHISYVKHQIIGFRALIDDSSKQYVHHINFFECNVPPTVGTSENIFEKYLSHPGGHCYHRNMPPEWGQYCMTVPFVWVAGAEGLMLPEEGGIPLGENNNGTTYFMLEIHYDNPKLDEFEDSSGVRIFVTDKPRENDIGAVTIHTRFSQFHLIPPGMKSFKNFAYCTEECTRQTIPPEGVTVTHATLHAHLTARKIMLRHIRDGVELPPIAKDDHYDFNYQQSRIVSPPRKIYPGDIILTECEFDTTERTTITYGGTSTRDEMCQGYIYFYPRGPLASCKTQYDFNNFFNAIGIQRVDGSEVLDRLQLPYNPKVNQRYDPGDDVYVLKNSSDGIPKYVFDLLNVGEPSSYRGQTVREYVNELQWTKNDNALTKRVWKQWWEGKHDAFCTGHSFKHIPLKEYSVSYPEFKQYVKPVSKKCVKNPATLRADSSASSTNFSNYVFHLVFVLMYAGARALL